MADTTDWPSRTQFIARGRYDLYLAVRDHGGHLYWARRVGARLSSAQLPRGVPEEVLVEEARVLVAQEGRLPNQERLRLMGHPRLATAVQRAGGAKRFAEKHGL